MNDPLSALVVDDEAAIRRLTVRALKEYDFRCDEAVDGEQALSLVWQRKYDVVVTDLRMPKRHGHSLAIEVLAIERDRPAIIVLTGVLEPKLASDLIARGIDDVQFKPIDFRLFGAKVRALCLRRRKLKAELQADKPANGTSSPTDTPDSSTDFQLEEQQSNEQQAETPQPVAAVSSENDTENKPTGWKVVLSQLLGNLSS